MANTTKTLKNELPEGMPENSVQLSVADPQAIEEGKLWIRMPNGELVNMNAGPDTFDAVVTQYVDLWDRKNWPVGQRALLVDAAAAANARLPVYYIPEDSLTQEMIEQRTACVVVDTEDSVQVHILEENATKEEVLT